MTYFAKLNKTSSNANTIHILKFIFLGEYMSSKVEITGINTSQLPKLSASEQLELMKKLKEGDLSGREKFALCNMRLVLSVVQRFKNRITTSNFN